MPCIGLSELTKRFMQRVQIALHFLTFYTISTDFFGIKLEI